MTASLGDDDEEWDKDPSGFDDLLSQVLDHVDCSQATTSTDASAGVISQESHQSQPEKHVTSQPASQPPKTVTTIAESDSISRTGCVIDHRLEKLDPKPDLGRLFRLFDERFFDGNLQQHDVRIEWSHAMTLSAGKCDFYPRTKRCIIKLSTPLVRQAPRADLVQTLLHEMIHAQLFVSGEKDGHKEHGPLFTNHMARINTLGQCYITLRHKFDVKWRIWQCNGACAKKPPEFGRRKKSNDMPPGPEDKWFQRHQETCCGSFMRVPTYVPKEPSSSSLRDKKERAKKSKDVLPQPLQDIRTYFKIVAKPTKASVTERQQSIGKDASSEKEDTGKLGTKPEPEVIVLD